VRVCARGRSTRHLTKLTVQAHCVSAAKFHQSAKWSRLGKQILTSSLHDVSFVYICDFDMRVHSMVGNGVGAGEILHRPPFGEQAGGVDGGTDNYDPAPHFSSEPGLVRMPLKWTDSPANVLNIDPAAANLRADLAFPLST